MDFAQPPEILLLEDDEDQAFLTQKTLSRAVPPSQIRLFRDGAAALKWLALTESRVVFCLLDLHMPGLPGEGFLRKLKNIEHTGAFPVILLTSAMNEAEIRAAYEAGAAGYIPKPLSAEHNLQRLQNYLDLLQIKIAVWPYGLISKDAGTIY